MTIINLGMDKIEPVALNGETKDVVLFADSFNDFLERDLLISSFLSRYSLFFDGLVAVLALIESDGSIRIHTRNETTYHGLNNASILESDNNLLSSCIRTRQVIINPVDSQSIDLVPTHSITIPLISSSRLMGCIFFQSATLQKLPQSLLDSIHYFCARFSFSLYVSSLHHSSTQTNAIESPVLDRYQLSVLTHELRTPLNGVIASCGVLSNTALNIEQRRIHNELFYSANTLNRMIDTFLSYSKICISDDSIDSRYVNLRKTIKSITSTFSFKANKKRIRFKTVYFGYIPEQLNIDKSAIENILFHILSNSITFTDKGSVTLFVHFLRLEEKSHIKFSISDTGVGMSENFLSHIFDPYSQENPSTVSPLNRSGMGLGMTIVEYYVKLLKGDIKIRSSFNEGTQFEVLVPITDFTTNSALYDTASPMEIGVVSATIFDHLSSITEDSALADNLTYTRYDKLDNALLSTSSTVDIISNRTYKDTKVDYLHHFDIKDELIIVDAYIDTNNFITEHFNSLPYHSITFLNSKHGFTDILKTLFTLSSIPSFYDYKTIKSKSTSIRRALIAEDDIVSQRALKMILESNQFIVDITDNGLSAYERYKKNSYDLVVLDIQMPKLDGVSTLKKCRSLGKGDFDTKFVVMSAKDDQSIIDECMNNGVSIYFTKPIESDFIFKINQLFETDLDLVPDTLNELDSNDSVLIFNFPKEIFNHTNLQYSLNSGHDYTKDIILLYVASSLESVNWMDKAIHDKNYTLVRHYAHKLRSSSQQACIHIFEDILKSIEERDDKDCKRYVKTFLIDYYTVIERIYLILNNIKWITESEKDTFNR